MASSFRYLKDSLPYIKAGEKKWQCHAGELYFSIFPGGQFGVCDEIVTPLNILEKDFSSSYKSPKFQNFLKLVRNNCEGCFYSCWREVSGLVNSPSVMFDRVLTLARVKKKELSSR